MIFQGSLELRTEIWPQWERSEDQAKARPDCFVFTVRYRSVFTAGVNVVSESWAIWCRHKIRWRQTNGWIQLSINCIRASIRHLSLAPVIDEWMREEPSDRCVCFVLSLEDVGSLVLWFSGSWSNTERAGRCDRPRSAHLLFSELLLSSASAIGGEAKLCVCAPAYVWTHKLNLFNAAADLKATLLTG